MTDLAAWVERLHRTMALNQPVYDAEPDQLLKRNKAGVILGSVVSSLLELPEFKNDNVHLALKDLMIFLADLDRGRKHPWSAPVNFGGTNVTMTAQSELKIWIRAVFGVLSANGFEPVDAYRHIAVGLTHSGRSGRNGAPVRWQRVQIWCLEPATAHDQRVRDQLERWWVDFRAHNTADQRNDGRDTASERELAGRFADLCWSLEHLRDRSVSGVSE